MSSPGSVELMEGPARWRRIVAGAARRRYRPATKGHKTPRTVGALRGLRGGGDLPRRSREYTGETPATVDDPMPAALTESHQACSRCRPTTRRAATDGKMTG